MISEQERGRILYAEICLRYEFIRSMIATAKWNTAKAKAKRLLNKRAWEKWGN